MHAQGSQTYPFTIFLNRNAPAEADIIAALSEGGNAIGIRVRPAAACADIDPATNHSSLCPADSERAGSLALRGKKSKISYMRFEGGNMAEWAASACTTR